MSAIALAPDDLRRQAARLACAILRLDALAAHPNPTEPSSTFGALPDAYVFLPSWRSVPAARLEDFLLGLPSPGLLVPTTTRGVIALTLQHELSGERRRWADKTIANLQSGLRQAAARHALAPTDLVALEFGSEAHQFPLAAIAEWVAQFPVNVGWSLVALPRTERARGLLLVRRSDGARFPGRSCMSISAQPPTEPREQAT